MDKTTIFNRNIKRLDKIKTIMTIPSYEQAKDKKKKDRTALDKFIVSNTPAGNLDEAIFYEQLQDVINEISLLN